MIRDSERYFALSGDIPIGGPSTWHITDWDQRRVISVTMDEEQDDENLAIEHLTRHSSQLPLTVFRIHVSPAGEIVSTHSDEEDDKCYCVHHPDLHDVDIPEGIQTIRRNELIELDRLGPDVDLVEYTPSSKGPCKKAVFKYYFQWQYADRAWDELNLWMRLPCHPNIVAFDRVVLDELDGRVIGFTNDYVPDGTIEENQSRVFRLKWLEQLISVVDELNLRYGIAHQDIAPRNLLVDEAADSVRLFDFNFAARIKYSASENSKRYREDRNDIKGTIFTIYELITRDDGLRSVPHEEQNVDILDLVWVKHSDVKLDNPVKAYQRALREWREQRAKDPRVLDEIEPLEAIKWPPRPEPPLKEIIVRDLQGRPHPSTVDMMFESRQEVRERGGKVLNWEWPPQELLDGKTRMLSTGKAAGS